MTRHDGLSLDQIKAISDSWSQLAPPRLRGAVASWLAWSIGNPTVTPAPSTRRQARQGSDSGYRRGGTASRTLLRGRSRGPVPRRLKRSKSGNISPVSGTSSGGPSGTSGSLSPKSSAKATRSTGTDLAANCVHLFYGVQQSCAVCGMSADEAYRRLR